MSEQLATAAEEMMTERILEHPPETAETEASAEAGSTAAQAADEPRPGPDEAGPENSGPPETAGPEKEAGPAEAVDSESNSSDAAEDSDQDGESSGEAEAAEDKSDFATAAETVEDKCDSSGVAETVEDERCSSGAAEVVEDESISSSTAEGFEPEGESSEDAEGVDGEGDSGTAKAEAEETAEGRAEADGGPQPDKISDQETSEARETLDQPEEAPGRTGLRLARPVPEYDAADQFDSIEGQTFLAMPVQVNPSPEAAVFVAAELAERTHIVESASDDGAPAPISAAPLQARPIREAAIQIIQTGKPPFPIKPKPKAEDKTALASAPEKKPEPQAGPEQNDGVVKAAPAKTAQKAAPPLSAPLGDPLLPTRRAIASIAAETTFIAQPLPLDGAWFEHDALTEEYDRAEDEAPEEEAAEVEVDEEVSGGEEGAETEEPDEGPGRVVLPIIPPPAPSLNMPADRTVACFSQGLMKIPNLGAFLGHEVVFQPADPRTGVGAVITWGGKDNLAARRAMMFAKKYDLPLWRLEDGFLRSLDLGSRGAVPMSLVADRTGIYYDANRPSDLENLLNSTGWETPELLAAAEKAIRLIKEEGLSKYNYGRPAPEGTITGGKRGRRRILVLDQTRGDLSVSLGLGGPETFTAMLKAARYEHPGEEFYIKTHPEVIAGRKQGYFDLRRQTGLTVIAEDFSPLSLIAQADEIYTVSSQMGLEALFLEKKVHCFGLPFYAGWGLTQDRLATPRRTRERTLAELIAAAYILYPRYVNPVTGRPADVFDVIRLLTDQRRHNNAARGFWAVSGFSFWKRDHARAFLSSTEGGLGFALTPGHARLMARRKHGRIAVWASKFYSASPGDGPSPLEGAEVVRVEDGFLRSVGLGSDFRPPYSLILDPEGIYYDYSRPSRLERLLAEFDFNEHQELVVRASQLIQAMVERGLSKYNRVGARHLSFKPPADRRIILVPGQVETDASVIHGSPQIASNAALLAEVRNARPDDFIIYKPHPDVESGNRLGQVPDHVTAKLADRVAAETELAALLPFADELHTMTSLAGFEALIRGIDTYTYGGPFYAGWKLTFDRLDFPRRGRRLTAGELAAAALILYPTYYDWRTGLFCGPEEIIHRLSQGETEPDLKAKILLAVRDFLRKNFKKYGGPR